MKVLLKIQNCSFFVFWYMGTATEKWLFDIYIYIYIISLWVIVCHRIAFMGNSTNSWLFCFALTVNITQMVLMLSNLWTAYDAVLVYYVWYTSFSLFLYIFKILRTKNNANLCLFYFDFVSYKFAVTPFFLISLSVLSLVMESFWL